MNRYFLSGMSSYMIWGVLPVVFKQIAHIDVNHVLIYRIFISTIALLLAVGLTSKSVRKRIRTMKAADWRRFGWRSLIGGSLMMINWLSYIYVVNRISINAAAFAYMILPISTAFLAALFIRESLNRHKWIGIALGAVSCLLMANVDLDQLQFILIVTFSYSFYLITQRDNQYFNRQFSLAVQLILCAIAVPFIYPDIPGTYLADSTFMFYIILISVVFTVIPLVLNLYALNGIQASQLAFMVYISPITSFILAAVFFGEETRPLEWVAYGILAGAVTVFNWQLIRYKLLKSAN